jgi:predicted MFS family arabinose efflux permease
MRRSRLAYWNPWHGLGELPRGIWIIFAASLIQRASTMSLPFLVLYLISVLGFPVSHTGLALTCFGTGLLAAAPLSGLLCDRLGAGWIMKASLFLSAAILLAFPLAKSPFSVLVAAFALALASESFRPASLAALSGLVCPERRKAAFAVSRLAGHLGMSLGPAVGGFLATVSFTSLFWFDAVTALLAGLVLTAHPLHIAGDPDTMAPAGDELPAPSSCSVAALRDLRFLLFLAVAIPITLVFFQVEGAMPLYLVEELHIPKPTYGLLFTASSVMIVIFEVRLNLLTSHWSYRKALALGALLLGAGFGALALCRGPWSVLGTVVLWTCGEMILLPGMASYVAELAPRDRQGEYMGLYTMVWGLALSFGPWLGIEVLERFGSQVLWLSTFACAVISAVLMGAIHKRGTAALPDPGKPHGDLALEAEPAAFQSSSGCTSI